MGLNFYKLFCHPIFAEKPINSGRDILLQGKIPLIQCVGWQFWFPIIEANGYKALTDIAFVPPLEDCDGGWHAQKHIKNLVQVHSVIVRGIFLWTWVINTILGGRNTYTARTCKKYTLLNYF